jgi:hypothetical protein
MPRIACVMVPFFPLAARLRGEPVPQFGRFCAPALWRAFSTIPPAGAGIRLLTPRRAPQWPGRCCGITDFSII